MGKKNRIINQIWKPSEIYNNFNESAFENNMAFSIYYDRMKEICLSRYVWIDLPSEIDKRFIEYVLFDNPGIAFYKEDILDNYYSMLPFNPTNRFNNYENPTKIEVYSPFTAYHRTLERKEYEIVWSNFLRKPDFITVEFFAKRLYETQRTIDVNIINQGNPKLVKAPQQQRLTVKNFLKNVLGFVPFIEVPNTFDQSLIEVMDISSPYISDKLDIHKNMVWNEFLTWAGIENSNQDKKERLVADEVGSNYGNVEISRNSGLMCRQEAAEKINKKFGLDIKVKFNSNLTTMLNRAYEELIIE